MAPSRAETQPSSEGRWEIRIVARGMLDDQMPVLVQDQGRSRKAQGICCNILGCLALLALLDFASRT